MTRGDDRDIDGSLRMSLQAALTYSLFIFDPTHRIRAFSRSYSAFLRSS